MIFMVREQRCGKRTIVLLVTKMTLAVSLFLFAASTAIAAGMTKPFSPQPLIPSTDNPQAWPDELTLERALAASRSAHPQSVIGEANIQKEQARIETVNAQTGLQSQLSTRLRWIDPPAIALDQTQGDHLLQLTIDKPLYDFGRSSAQLAAGQAALASARQQHRAAENQYRVTILSAYFDVLLADMAYARDNEGMSMAYVRFDRAQQRNELGQLSDIALMEKNSEYQATRVQRYRSSMAQRSTRAQLANILNRPGQLPNELSEPKLEILQRSIPEEIGAWVKEAEIGNVLLLTFRLRVKEAQEQLSAANASDNPLLVGNAEVSRFSRETAGRDNWRAGVSLHVPLTTGGRRQAESAKFRAELTKRRAQLEQYKRDMSQSILELWGELQALKVAREYAQSETEFRDLYLDRSRALYEMEVNSDLGDAMVKTTAVRYQTQKTNFMMALTWARLDALLGRRVFSEHTPAPMKMETPP